MLNPKKWREKIAKGVPLPPSLRPVLWKILSGSAAEKEQEQKEDGGGSFEACCKRADVVFGGTAAAAAAEGSVDERHRQRLGNAARELATAIERRGGGDEVTLLGRAARALIVRHNICYCPGMLDSLGAVARVVGGCADDQPVPPAAVEDAFWIYGRLLSRRPHPLSPLLSLDAAAADAETARWAALLEQYVLEIVSAETRANLPKGGSMVRGPAGNATDAGPAASAEETSPNREMWKESVTSAIMPLLSRQLANAPAARARVLDSLVCEGPRVLFAAVIAIVDVAGAALGEECGDSDGTGVGAWFLRTTIAGSSAEEKAFLEALQRVLEREEMAPKNFALLSGEFGMFGMAPAAEDSAVAANDRTGDGKSGATETTAATTTKPGATKESQCTVS